MPRTEPIKAARGVHDILPVDMPVWRAAEGGARDVASRFGYEEIVTPLIEQAEPIERIAEVIELAQRWLNAVGVETLRLELNSIGDEKCRPQYLEKLRAYYRPFNSKLHGDCQLRLERNPLRLLDCKVPQCQPFKANAPRITDHLCDECAAHWAAVRRLLEGAGIGYQHHPYLVRGLDYYTRTVFEFYPGGATGQQDALASGGRYDGLAEAEGWPPTPGVGFAGGLDRVTELMAAKGEEVAIS